MIARAQVAQRNHTLKIVEKSPTRLVMRHAGEMNAALAWSITAVGGIATVASIVFLISAGHNPAAPGISTFATGIVLAIVSIVLFAAGLYCLSTVCETTCTFDTTQGRFQWRRKQVFRTIDEKRFPLTSIKAIEVTQKKVGSSSTGKAKRAYWWFVVTKSGTRFEEPGPGSPTPYDADNKANQIRAFLGQSLVPTGQDTDGNERGIGDRTVFGVLAQLTDPSLRDKKP